MVINRTHDGFVLLMMLIMILGAGSSWLGVSLYSRQGSLSPDRLSERDAQHLIDARQSLLSYATLYPWLYGPSGAGPAHLPCPDTDGYREHGVLAESGMTQRRDGSNPPCASVLSSDGHLPRHTVLPGSRYLFHAEPWQRFVYRVAGNVVNNPINRIVNLQLLSNSEQSTLARISLHSSIDASVVGEVVIKGTALRDSTAASVAAWVKARVATSSGSSCTSPADDGVLPDSVEANASADICGDQQSRLSECNADRLFIYLLDKPFQYSQNGCLADNLHLNTMEGVLATRHWFVRNLWHEWVDISYGPGCNPSVLSGALPSTQPRALSGDLADSACELRYLPNTRFNDDLFTDQIQIDNTVLLQWRLPS